jgi:Nucleotidyltransferase domain
MRALASRLATIPGVVAVTLGGSRATATHGEGSDWDFGLYYRGTINPTTSARMDRPGTCSHPGLGRLVNSGAWLRVDGVAVDLVYRDLDEVLAWTARASESAAFPRA